jgi:hypothetical protein
LPIKIVAQSAGYYEPAIEARLNQEIERPANHLLKRLRSNQPVSKGERWAIARYLETMLKRVPRGRARAEAAVAPSIDSTFRDLHAEAAKAAAEGRMSPERLAEIQRELDQRRRYYEAEVPPEVLEVVRDPMPSDRLAAVLNDMVWRVLIAPIGEVFITSDNPAFFHEGYGLGDEKAELRFPLSPTHALHATWYDGPGGPLSFHNTTRDWVREFNRSQAHRATALVFADRKASWIRTLLDRKNPYLFRLTWYPQHETA